MHSTSILRRYSAAAIAAAAIAALAACGSPSKAAGGSSGGGSSSGASGAPIKVGLVYSETGALADYGKDYYQGFLAGLDYATHGTDAVNGHKIEVVQRDDAGDPTKAVSAAKDLIGQGYHILAGSTASGVALQVAPLAAQNKVLFISGPAATDEVTGLNKYTFRSGRETYQDIATAATFVGDLTNKHVTVLAQDSAFGQANVAAVKAVLGAKGAKVDSVLAPPSATDLTPFATQAKCKPDLLFVAWAGTTAQALWTALSQQGVLDSTTTVTGLDVRASYPVFASTGGKVSFLAHYVPGGTSNDAAKAMDAYLTAHGQQSDLFSPDGFTAAQMVVHAAENGDTDVDAMVKNLEGWSFDGVKGAYSIRASDHALLQPMFQAKLDGTTPTVVKTLDPNEVAPPAKSFPGELTMGDVLSLTGLSWTVGGSAILSGVDLSVGEGEFVAVIGPNGAGKTSLFNLISGLNRVSAGRIALDGADITTEPPHKRARRGIGRTFQSSSVFPTMTVGEHVALAQQVAAKRRGEVVDPLERVRLTEKSGALAADLSHGDKRKLELAMLLASGAERLLLLDEPMAGVASGDVPDLVEVIRTLHRDEGRTVLMVEHHMEVLLGLADRVAVMHHGALLAIDTPERIMADPRVQEAYVGDAL